MQVKTAQTDKDNHESGVYEVCDAVQTTFRQYKMYVIKEGAGSL